MFLRGGSRCSGDRGHLLSSGHRRSAVQLQLWSLRHNVSSGRHHQFLQVTPRTVRLRELPEVRVHRSPDEVAAAAQQRVQRLEAALHTLGDEDTPEVKSLQDALKKAKVAAQGILVVVQLEECQKFVARCEKRIAALDVERSRELERLEEGKSNLERLRLMMTSQVVPPPDSSSEVEQLRRQVADLQQQLGQGADAPPCAKRQAVVPKERTVRLRGGFRAHVRFRDRPMDARPSSRSPRRQPHGECERSHEVVPRDSRDSIRHGPIFRVAFHGDEFHQVGAVRIVTHQCGMRGIRVGEAKNPGPSRRPVRPIHGRDVARRTASEHGTTLDSDSDAPLARVGPRLGTRHEDCPQSRVLPRATLLDSDSDAPVMPTAVCGQLLDALEEDLMQPVIPQKKRVRRVSDSPSPTATHFDLTVADSVDEVVEHDTPQDMGHQAERSHQCSESDTKSVRQIRSRRLVLSVRARSGPLSGRRKGGPT